MKRLIALFLSFSLVFGLAGCSSSSDDSSDSNSKTSEEEMEISFEELVVVDNDQCAITITGIDPDGLWGYTLDVTLENKSSDKTYMFSCSDAYINNVECNPLFADEVTAGNKANSSIEFTNSDLEENGITEYTDIELSFRVYNSDDWSEDDAANVTVHVYPYGEENATAYERAASEDDEILVDNDQVTIIVTGYEPDGLFGYTVNLYLVNKTASTVMFSVDNASVNGYMIDPFYAHSVGAGKAAFSSMYWYDSNLEENGITDVETIQFELTAYNYDDWSAADYVDQTITLNP